MRLNSAAAPQPPDMSRRASELDLPLLVPAGQAPRGGAILHELLQEQALRHPRTTDGEQNAGSELRERVRSALLGRTHTHRRREVARTFRLPYVTARRIWQTLGLPSIGSPETPFTDLDLDAVPAITNLRRVAAMDDELVLDITRAISRSTDRLAAWQTGVVMNTVSTRCSEAKPGEAAGKHHAEERRKVVEELLELSAAVEPLLVYSWRRHLVAALDQLIDGETDDDIGHAVSVGFADLVGFTSAVKGMSETQLSDLVGEFERLALDVVGVHGGRVVKTLGDEVLFVCDRPAGAAAIGLDLVEALRDDPTMPALRVGISTGTVLSYSGDVFGTTVNRASRFTAVTEPDTVMVDSATQQALSSVSGFELLSLEDTALQGLGPTQVWELRRTSVPHRRGPVSHHEHRPTM